MNNPYTTFLVNQSIPGQPLVNYDASRKQLVHVYQNIPLQTNNFQKEVSSYLSRKESYSGNVVVISKIKDQRITYKSGSPAMEISVVTDYVPWRLHATNNPLTYQQALFVLDGACKGFRELLHRVRSPFIIQSYMIGVDGQANVKVWWNQYYSDSKFGFQMNTHMKLDDMVKSLMQVLVQKMQKRQEWPMLQKLINSGQITFMKLQEKIKQASKKLNFKQIGMSLISKVKEHSIVLQQLGKMESNNHSPIEQSLRLSFGSMSSRKGYLSSQRMILSPRKQEKLQFNRKVITKRIYRDGTSPNMNEKLNVIKGDIQNLRQVANKDLRMSMGENNLRTSKSVQAIVSLRKGLKGDTSIPEVKKKINQSEMVGKSEELMFSRFVQPQINPQNIKSQQNIGQGQTSPLYLSRLKKMIGQDKQINSTSRSINQSRFEQFMSSSYLKQGKFGQSDKKIPYMNSFSEL